MSMKSQSKPSKSKKMRKMERASAMVHRMNPLNKASITIRMRMKMRKKEKKRVKKNLRKNMTSKSKALTLATILMIHRVLSKFLKRSNPRCQRF